MAIANTILPCLHLVAIQFVRTMATTIKLANNNKLITTN